MIIRGALPLALSLGLVLAACGAPAAPTPSPSAGSVPPAGPTPTPLAPPTLPAAFTPSPTGCPPLSAVTGPWPSDRLTAVEAVDGGFEDVVRFVFGQPSAPGATATVAVSHPTPELIPGEPDDPVDIRPGLSRVVRIEGLDPNAFAGERDLRPNLVSVGQVKVIDETADSMTWGIGASEACLSLRTSTTANTIEIGFSHAIP